MNRWKSSLTCPFCSKILEDPIELPCGHLICRHHLTEKTLLKETKIECAKCKQEFNVKSDEFRANKFMKQLIDDKVYLSDEEISLKKTLDEAIKVFYETYEEFIVNKNKLDLECHNHFQEIRRSLDIHREEVKEKIDEIYLEMIERTKTFESCYLKSLDEKLTSTLKTYETKSVETELNEINEKLRDPNVLIESLIKMQVNTLEDIKSKLNEMSQVKEHLKAFNEFKPNVTFEQNVFGTICLNEYSETFSSEILTCKQSLDLIKLCQFNPKDKWRLLYRGTRDGFKANDFHTACDDQSLTLTIFKAKETPYIFGGFTSEAWQSGSGDFKTDPNAFLFSLTNKENLPCKMNIAPNLIHNAIQCYSGYGPTFGGGYDIRIVNDANLEEGSYSNLGDTYKHPKYAAGTVEAQTFLAGAKEFRLSEIEVFRKE
jgi:hypothetical protein